MLDAILRLSLGVLALVAIGGVALSVGAWLSTGDRAMALCAVFFGWMAGVCGLSALTPPAPGGQP